MNRTDRVVARWRLRLAMSLQQAKETLGFPATYTPSPDEILKAYRQKSIENHPDRGGTHEKMVEVNVAKEILDGKRSPDGTNRYTQKPQTYNTPPTPRPQREPPKVVDTIRGVSFEAAVSKAGLPTNIEWKCVSKPMWGSNSASQHYNSDVWTLIGKNEQKYYCASFQHRKENDYFSAEKNGLIKIEESWSVNVVSAPSSKDPLKTLPSLVRSPSVLFEDGTLADPPKKWVMYEGPNGKLDDRWIQKVRYGSGGAALKDVLLQAGWVNQAAVGLTRKSTVEMIPHYSKERGDRVRKENGGKLYHYQAFTYEVRINGKSESLADDTIKNLEKNGFIMAVFSYDPSDNRPRQLHKLKGGRLGLTTPSVIIRLLADSLTSEPSWLHIALEKAAEEWE